MNTRTDWTREGIVTLFGLLRLLGHDMPPESEVTC